MAGEIINFELYQVGNETIADCDASACTYNTWEEDFTIYPRQPQTVSGSVENLVATEERFRQTEPVSIKHCKATCNPHLVRLKFFSGTCTGFVPKETE